VKGLESAKYLNRKSTIEVLYLNAFVNLFLFSNQVFGRNPLRDVQFKQLHHHQDAWYFVDYKHWDIKAPDKWQHFPGCYIIQKILSRHLNKYLSASLVTIISILKEHEDAYREVWSGRDILVDFLGILRELTTSENIRYYVYMITRRLL
jgi:hypothetical protein